MDAQALIAIGGLIAALTALVKGAIPTTEYPQWVSLLIVGAISLAVLALAVQSGRIQGDAFELLAQWVQFVLAGVGVREVATVPGVAGRTLSDLPTRTGTD